MILTRSGEHAIRAVIHLAEASGEEPVRTAEIAEALGAPRNYLSKLLHQLARAGVLRSERGPRGGFSLAVPAGELTLADVLAPIESERLDQSCLLGRPRCSDDDPCPIHDDWKRLREHIGSFLNDTTIADLGRVGAGGDAP